MPPKKDSKQRRGFSTEEQKIWNRELEEAEKLRASQSAATAALASDTSDDEPPVPATTNDTEEGIVGRLRRTVAMTQSGSAAAAVPANDTSTDSDPHQLAAGSALQSLVSKKNHNATTEEQQQNQGDMGGESDAMQMDQNNNNNTPYSSKLPSGIQPEKSEVMSIDTDTDQLDTDTSTSKSDTKTNRNPTDSGPRDNLDSQTNEKLDVSTQTNLKTNTNPAIAREEVERTSSNVEWGANELSAALKQFLLVVKRPFSLQDQLANLTTLQGSKEALINATTQLKGQLSLLEDLEASLTASIQNTLESQSNPNPNPQTGEATNLDGNTSSRTGRH